MWISRGRVNWDSNHSVLSLTDVGQNVKFLNIYLTEALCTTTKSVKVFWLPKNDNNQQVWMTNFNWTQFGENWPKAVLAVLSSPILLSSSGDKSISPKGTKIGPKVS